MLIVSRFHDYYDSGMKLGIDKTCVYKRETVRVVGNFPYINGHANYFEWDSCVLAFCGEFYPFVYRTINGEVDTVVWDVEEAVKLIPTENKHRNYMWGLRSEAAIRQFFDANYPQMEKLYHEYRTPVFGFSPSTSRWVKKEYNALMINPSLKDIEFYKVKDPITAYQEIYMFMSGVIGAPLPPKEKVDDKIMAASKGHDGEYSFRKPPGKRGKNRWR